MRDDLQGYIKKSDNEIGNIWKNAIITFDANVLLNLYRYSKKTRTELLKTINLFSDQVWLSHQSVYEYHKNRYEVIAEQEKAYSEFNKSIEKIELEISNKNRPPFLLSSLHDKLSQILREVKNDVTNSIATINGMLHSDSIYLELDKIFRERIGDPLQIEEYENLLKEGADRYEKKIPPGFKDEDKKMDNKYGDLILWKQLIMEIKSKGKPLILVTDERKTDWWWRLKNGKTIGPRPELINELWREAKMPFLMYSSERFLLHASEFKKQEINEKAIEEVQERARIEVEFYKSRRRNRRRMKSLVDYMNERQKVAYPDRSMKELLFEIDQFRERINQLNVEIRSAEIADDFDLVNLLVQSKKRLSERIDRNLEQISLLKESGEDLDSSDRDYDK